MTLTLHHRKVFCFTGPLWGETTQPCKALIFFFVLSLNKLFNKPSNCQWFGMPWCTCNISVMGTSHTGHCQPRWQMSMYYAHDMRGSIQLDDICWGLPLWSQHLRGRIHLHWDTSDVDHRAMLQCGSCDHVTVLIMGPSGIILWMRPANERRRYIVTSSLIGWAHTQNDPWAM